MGLQPLRDVLLDFAAHSLFFRNLFSPESAVIPPELKISSPPMLASGQAIWGLKDVDQSKPLECCALKPYAGRHDHPGDLLPAH